MISLHVMDNQYFRIDRISLLRSTSSWQTFLDVWSLQVSTPKAHKCGNLENASIISSGLMNSLNSHTIRSVQSSNHSCAWRIDRCVSRYSLHCSRSERRVARNGNKAPRLTVTTDVDRTGGHGCQIGFLDCMCFALRDWRTMALLRYAAKFDPFLSLDCAPRPPPWCSPRKEGIKFCHLATLQEKDPCFWKKYSSM